jgi:hypothetical protein
VTDHPEPPLTSAHPCSPYVWNPFTGVWFVPTTTEVSRDDLVTRGAVIDMLARLANEAADLALEGEPDNARGREAMEAALTRAKYAMAFMPASPPPAEVLAPTWRPDNPGLEEKRLRLLAQSSIVGGDIQWALRQIDGFRDLLRIADAVVDARPGSGGGDE